MRILIGKDYFEEFKSVYHLVKECPTFKGGLKGYATSGVWGGDNTERSYANCSITYNQDVYLYDSTKRGAEFEADTDGNVMGELGFTKEGATWFECLRGSGVTSAENQWQSFMETVANAYHTAYSIVEYKQQKAHIDRDKAFDKASKLMHLLYPKMNLDKGSFMEITDKKTLENEAVDVYGITIRLALYPGTGAPKRVIGKLYLSGRTNKNTRTLRLDFMKKEAIEKFEDKFNSLNQDELGHTGDNNEIPIDADSIRTNVLTKLDEIVSDKRVHFTEFFYVSEQDKAEIEGLLKLTAHNDEVLMCSELKVLGISHIKWQTSTFDILVDGKHSFRMNFDLNDSITLKCLNCDTNNLLVRDDQIVLFSKEEDREIGTVKYIYNEEMDPEELELIRQQGLCNLHRYRVTCSIPGFDFRCERYRCYSQVFNSYVVTDEQGKEKRVNCNMLCNDCYNQEFVSYDQETGQPVPTDKTVLAVDHNGEKKMLLREKTRECPFCKSRLQKGKDKYCSDACRSAYQMREKTSKEMKEVKESEGYSDARKLYRQYAQTIPLGKRLGFKKKLAYGTRERVFLIVGTKAYQFDKLTVEETGRLKNATSID